MWFVDGTPAGRVVITRGAEEVASKGVDMASLVRRHLAMDWGDMCAEDKEANNRSIKDTGGAHSAYKTSQGEVWIITDPGGEVTTILLPDEY